MDAPIYPPSIAYEAPERLPQAMTTSTSSLADFLANPQARAIIEQEVPVLRMATSSPMLAPNLGNMSPRDLVMFGALKSEQLDRVDARLKAAGIIQGGSQ